MNGWDDDFQIMATEFDRWLDAAKTLTDQDLHRLGPTASYAIEIALWYQGQYRDAVASRLK